MRYPLLKSEPESGYYYPGKELELFAEARNLKRYLNSQLRPHLGRTVLEVGAGIGSISGELCGAEQDVWLCLEPDASNARVIANKIVSGTLPSQCQVSLGTIAELRGQQRFDSVLYIDVLEHIEHDSAELAIAAQHLQPGGKLVVLSPAYEWLFSRFDAEIGHFRRYTKQSILRTAPAELQCLSVRYLDSLGILASLANRMLLNASLPTAGQIKFWDRILLPASRVIDPVLGFSCGRSVLAVWVKP